MGISADFTQNDIRALIAKKVEAFEQTVFLKLQRVGNKFVRDARTKADFTDRTGNLRSSIGFIIFKNGQQLVGNFEKSAKGTDKAKGELQAKIYAEEIGGKYRNGFVLIVVAGMEYAAKVESKGKDVITGSSLAAQAELTRYFKR